MLGYSRKSEVRCNFKMGVVGGLGRGMVGDCLSVILGGWVMWVVISGDGSACIFSKFIC